MSRPNFIEEALARRHVEKHEDYLVQKHVQTLFDDLERVIKERDALAPAGFTPSGRWALRHIVLGLVMTAVLAAGGVYGYQFATSPAFREGMAQGHEDALKTEDRAMMRVPGR